MQSNDVIEVVTLSGGSAKLPLPASVAAKSICLAISPVGSV